MNDRIEKVTTLAKSATARDTAVLFSGNVLAAFLGFLFTLIIARALSVEEFGVFSAASNLFIILSSLSDLGLSSGIVNFVSEYLGKNDETTANNYAKAAFIIKVVIAAVLSLLVVVFAGFVSRSWLATSDKTVAYWTALLSFSAILWGFLPYILQAKKQFLKSVMIDISISLPKAIIPFLFIQFGVLTLGKTFLAYFLSLIIAGIVGLIFTGTRFLRAQARKSNYIDLLKFSGWLGVNRIVSSISGKLDIQMLAALAGAVATGLYSIPSRLASFISVLASSYSSVLAPRFSSFGDKAKEREYLIKSCLPLIPIVFGLILWIIIAHPFITILFGDKYAPSVSVFQALVAAMIPFMIGVPSVTAIIYGMKQTKFIGFFSFFQIAVIFFINLIFIPKFGVFGPTLALGVVNTALAIYSWTIVVRYYWGNNFAARAPET
jgi:O-antigen/teichoic acid export membrane protein